jgi:hypothetical protein
MNPSWGQFFMTQRGQFRMAFDTNDGLPASRVEPQFERARSVGFY